MLPPCCSPQDYFRPITGLPISTYFSAYKYLWLYENVDAVREAVDAGNACIGTIDSWLVWCLTGGASNGGVHITDGGCAMCVGGECMAAQVGWPLAYKPRAGSYEERPATT